MVEISEKRLTEMENILKSCLNQQIKDNLKNGRDINFGCESYDSQIKLINWIRG